MKFLKTSVLIFIPFLFFSCNKWKVSELASEEYSVILNGTESGKVKISSDQYGLNDLSVQLSVFNNSILLVDNKLKRIQVLDNDGDVDLLIGNTNGIKKNDLVKSSFKFDTIGSVLMDENKKIYVQNRISSKINKYKKREIDDSNIHFSPSYILVFNEKGNLEYTLGQKGVRGIPFYYIESLKMSNNGKLFVVSRSFNTWSVSSFKDKKRDFFVNLSKLKFEDKNDNLSYKGKIENLKIYNSGDKIMISVAFYHNLKLKYRKIYDYSVKKKQILKTVMRIPDAKNVLFNIIQDKYIYFWNLEEENIKFMICNLEGKILNNIRLRLEDKGAMFTSVISDREGNVYSYNISKDGVRVLKWK